MSALEPRNEASAATATVAARESPAALESADPAALDALARAHLRFAWIALLVFATLGAVLEALHAWKSVAYLGVGNEVRRLMWTLAHAHGVGLSLLHMGFAATLKLGLRKPTGRLALAARLLRWATVLLPAGFFLGGFGTYEGDPGIGIALAPFGVFALWTSVLLVALELVSDQQR
jgi:hypothetical protein